MKCARRGGALSGNGLGLTLLFGAARDDVIEWVPQDFHICDDWRVRRPVILICLQPTRQPDVIPTAQHGICFMQ